MYILSDNPTPTPITTGAQFTRLSESNWYSVYIKDDREMDDALDAPRHGLQGEARTQGRLA